jgi:predicted Zn-ribbon and HTH transcriptional regulator
MAGSIRQEMIELLRASRLSARDLSRALGIREREVYEHLGHVRLSMAASREERLVVEPARCLACGFAFRKRDRLRVPSRCPVCRGEHITEPLFEVVKP